ncbi:MAG: GNAT family N-acetyltransferase [Bacteroidales bacterium]|nr:GNAT family N-acetyltransferase [Bacteroidales bacterium]
MVNNKDKYASFCKNNSDVPVFMQDWWLDIVCANEWDVIFVEEDAKIIAVMPYCKTKKLWFKRIMSPPLTSITGYWIMYPQGISKSRKISFENNIMRNFSSQLAAMKLSFYSHSYCFKFSNWLGYFWNGFTQTTKFTYRIDLTDSWENIFASFNKTVRRRVLQSKNALSLSINQVDVNAIWQLTYLTFKKQNLQIPFDFKLFSNLIITAIEKKCGIVLSAENNNGDLLAYAFIVMDKETCYGIINSSNEYLLEQNAQTLLQSEAVKYAKENGAKYYDFCGSMLERVETFMRHFGAVQTPYNVIEKRYSKIYSLLRNLK